MLEGDDAGKNETMSETQAMPGAVAAAKAKEPTDDPMYYKQWWTILSRPVTKAKGQALLRELLSGLTVSLAQVPEAVAFSFTAGLDPIIGLQAAWIMGLITALFGGAPGMVSGATGAIAVVLPVFVEDNGLGYVFIAVFLMGIIQLLIGAIGGAKLIKLVGHPIMLGFCNGLAIVIGIAQLHSFKTPRYCPVDCDAPTYNWDSCIYIDPELGGTADSPFKCEKYTTGATAGFQTLETLATMAVVFFLPRLTRAFPASLAGILVGTIIEFAIVRTSGFETPTVGDIASVKGFFPIPIWVDDRYKADIPSLGDGKTWTTCLPISATMAVIGLVESLMTLQLVGQITGRKPVPAKEVYAQGAANVITGIFGGMGGCAMIGQSLINVSQNRARTRISTTISALFLLLIILVAYPVINLVPMASLAGVMFMVVIGTFEWHSLPIIFASLLPERLRSHPKLNWARKIKRTDVLIICLVTAVAVAANLAYAVASGVVLAALVFAWDQADMLEVNAVEPESLLGNPPPPSPSAAAEQAAKLRGVDSEGGSTTSEDMGGLDTVDEEIMRLDPSQVKVYQVKGALFFASAQRFISLFHAHHDPDTVVLYLDQAVLSDYSALSALNSVSHLYSVLGKRFLLRKVTEHSLRSIRKAGHLIYTFDKTKSAKVNESELLSMALAPSWDAILPDAGYDSDSNESEETSGTSSAQEPKFSATV